MARTHLAGPLRLLVERPAPTACFLASWPALAAAALSGQPLLFAAALAAAYLSDVALGRHGGRLDGMLRRVRFPLTVRFALRQLMLFLLLARTGVEETLLTVALASFGAYYVVQVPQSVLLALIRRSRKLPMASRNIDLTGLGLSEAPSRALTQHAFEKSMATDTLAMAGLLAGAATGDLRLGYLGCAAMLAVCLVYTGVLARLAARGLAMPDKRRVLSHLDDWLRGYRPHVMLYFSGTKASAYQVNMWLEPLAQAGVRPLIVLRERHILEALEPTPLPVLCLPGATDVMNRDFSSVRLVLYPSNVGPNIHMLRMPRVRHVFIGHGDSDKVASINPYAKVYDEVWTAGQAGRDRWAQAGVGVRDSCVQEVGRPQLEGVRRGQREPGDTPLNVLYAPTWEGWTTEPGNTSLIESGEAIVELLLSMETPVRVLYKPHPYTGIRAPEARAAHRRIVAMLKQANADRNAREESSREEQPSGESLREAEAARQSAREEMSEVQQRLATLGTRPRAVADDAERSRDARFSPQEAALRTELRRRRDELYWRGTQPWRHQHITGKGPHLYSCFNECDLLVSDISSVVSDFVASEKPYAITDVEEHGEAEFRRRYTAARAAFILSRDAHELYGVVRSVDAPSADSLSEERARLRHYLLGPDLPDAPTRFAEAIRAFAPAAAPIARTPADDPDDGGDGGDGADGADIGDSTTPLGLESGGVEAGVSSGADLGEHSRNSPNGPLKDSLSSP